MGALRVKHLIQEQGAAVLDGERVVFGVPIRLALSGGGWAAPNLVLAAAGDADPWVCCRRPAPGVVDLESASDRGLYVAGLPVRWEDLNAVDAALAAAPPAARRHKAGANLARLRAGSHALRVKDAMLRARLLDACDGWVALRESSVLLDDSSDGQLYDPPQEAELECRLLVVTCPSTARKYALRVSSACETAREARLWTLGDGWEQAPEVES